jgi:hypothetical protein
MKKLTLLLTLLSPIIVNAQSLIAFWDFNTLAPGDAVASTGELTPNPGLGIASMVGGTTYTFATGYSLDANTADNSGLNTTNYPAQGTFPKSAGAQFNVNTVGFNGVNLEFWQRLSNTSANTWVLQYTLDKTNPTPIWVNSTTFTFTPQATGTGDTWYFRSVNLSSVTALNNNANAAFRIVSDFDPISGQYLAARSTSTYALSGMSTGTSRFDLFRIFETPVELKIATASNFITVNENVGTVNIPVTISTPNQGPVTIQLGLANYTDATLGSDFLAIGSLIIPANSTGIFQVPITINDDIEAELAERLIVKILPNTNVRVHASEYYSIVYVKDNDYVAPTPTNELNLSLLSSFSNGPALTNSAEISAFDSSTNRLYIVNSIAKKLDIIDFNSPATPILLSSVNILPFGGGLNSVVAHDSVVAIAVENVNPQANGSVLFLDYNGNYINQIEVGAMPDMITFNKNFTKVLTANEGEPNATYTLDPEGSVSIIDLTPGYANLTTSNVTNIGFTSYNGQAAALRAQGIRVFSTSASIAQDFEPEYITISDDNTKAYVGIQENNAMLTINLATNTIIELRALGYSNYGLGSGNGLDASDQSGSVLITGNLPIKGAFMPDAITYATIANQGYIFTANEGDSREFGSVIDANRISSSAIVLDPTIFPDQSILKNNKFLGRLSALKYSGDTDLDGDLDEIHVMGGRSFSIFDAQTGTLVFDSKSLIEQITSNHSATSLFFNASNSTGAASSKNRSDDKGPEPEGVTHAVIDNKNYLFVSLERIGGVMVFNVETPSMPIYVGYYNNRTASGSGPDLGAEGILLIPANQSPNGNALMILSNEVSSTLSIYQINTCVESSMASLTAVDTSICEADTTLFTMNSSAGVNYEWYKDNNVILNETNDSLDVSIAGTYYVKITNTNLACSGKTNDISLTVNTIPNVFAGNDISICENSNTTLNGSGALTYTWNNGAINNVAFSPNTGGDYIVTGTDANGCIKADTLLIVLDPLPTVFAGNDISICENSNTVLNASGGALTYTWNNGVMNNIDFLPSAGGNYVVTGIDVNGCIKTDTLLIVLNALPNVYAGNDLSICENSNTVLNATGAVTYAWNNGILNNINFSPTIAGNYIVTGTDGNGCTKNDTLVIVINDLPNVSAGADQTVCRYSNVTLVGSGAGNYIWNNGVTNNIGFTALNNSIYTVTGTDTNGCSGTDQISLIVNNLPFVNAGTDQVVCAGQNVILNAQGALSYSWSNSVINNTAFTPNLTNTYNVVGTDGNGCTNTDQVLVTVQDCAGIEEFVADLSIFPNPTKGIITIENNQNSIQSISIIALNGKLIQEINELNDMNLVLDLSWLEIGVYILKINMNNQTVLKKVIVE